MSKSEKMEKIDDLDRKIIQIITKNARIPFKDICGIFNRYGTGFYFKIEKILGINHKIIKEIILQT